MAEEVTQADSESCVVAGLPGGFPIERPLPLGSKRLNIPLIKLIASAVKLPTPSTKEELLLMIEGKLGSEGYESQNFQVLIMHCYSNIFVIPGRAGHETLKKL